VRQGATCKSARDKMHACSSRQDGQDDRTPYPDGSRTLALLISVPAGGPRCALPSAPPRAAIGHAALCRGLRGRNPQRTPAPRTHCHGLTGTPSTRTSQCRCAPVERPVVPTRPIGSPACTSWPTRTRIADW